MTRLALALVLLVAVAAACGSSDSDESASTLESVSAIEVTGSLTYPQRIALAPGGTATITLEDVSVADAPATVVVEETIDLGDRQVPIPFELSVDPAELDARATYSVRASITAADGSLQWTTDTAHTVDADGDSVDLGDLTLVPVDGEGSGSDGAESPLTGTWNVIDIDGQPVLPDVPATLEFGTDGILGGSGSCNRYTTSFETDGDRLLLDPIGLTMMACTPEIDAQESAFLAVLDDDPTFELVDGDTLLLLESASGSTVSARR